MGFSLRKLIHNTVYVFLRLFFRKLNSGDFESGGLMVSANLDHTRFTCTSSALFQIKNTSYY
jgi:hypothetical protein